MFKALLNRKKTKADDGMASPDISRVVPSLGTGPARIVPKAAATTSTEPDTHPATVDTESPTPAAPEEDVLVLDKAVDPLSEDEHLAEADDDEGDTGIPSGDWLDADIQALRAAADTAMADPGDGEAQRLLFLVAHNMHGAAGPYGFPVIERITGSLCQLLEDDDDIASALPLVNLHVEACRAAANHQDTTGAVDLAEAVCTALEDQVAARLTARA